MTTWFGWRASFVGAGLSALVIALLTLVFVMDKPWDEKEPKGKTVASEQEAVLQSILFVVKKKSFWPLAGWFFFCNGLFFTFAGLWGGPYLEQVYNLDKASVGDILSMIAIGIVIGGLLLSNLSNRFFSNRKSVVILSAFIVLGLVCVLSLFSPGLPTPALYLIYLLFGVFGNGVVALGFTITKEVFPSRVSGTALGLVNVFWFLGAALLQPTIGLLLENDGIQGGGGVARYQHSFVAFLLCSGACLITSFLISESQVRE